MTHLARALLVSLCFCCLAAPSIAQSSKSGTETAAKKIAAGSKPVNNAAANVPRAERRATALSLLVTLADDVRTFTTKRLRARTQGTNRRRNLGCRSRSGARTLSQGVDAAELADQESARRMEEDRRRQQAANGSVALPCRWTSPLRGSAACGQTRQTHWPPADAGDLPPCGARIPGRQAPPRPTPCERVLALIGIGIPNCVGDSCLRPGAQSLVGKSAHVICQRHEQRQCCSATLARGHVRRRHY